MGKKGRGIKLLGILLLGSLILSSCKSNNDLKFGIMMPDFNTPYFIDAITHFENSISSIGGIVLSADAQNNEQLQIKQASDLIEQGVSVIVIDAVNANTAGAIVRNAHKNGVKVIAYDRMIRNCDLDFYISYNSVKIGEMMATYAIDRKPKGNYILFYGDSGDMNAHAVKQGQLNILNPHIVSGDVNVIYQTYIDNWAGINAYHKMTNILNFSDEIPDVLLSSYDGMSTSSIKAFEDFGLSEHVIVTGQNGEIEAYKNIIKGKQAMTIYKPAKIMATEAAKVAWQFATTKDKVKFTSKHKNGRIDIPSILLDPILIDKNNIKKEIISNGIFTENELNQ